MEFFLHLGCDASEEQISKAYDMLQRNNFESRKYEHEHISHDFFKGSAQVSIYPDRVQFVYTQIDVSIPEGQAVIDEMRRIFDPVSFRSMYAKEVKKVYDLGDIASDG